MSGFITSPPKFQFANAQGNPMSGGMLTSYLAGSTALASTYQDELLSIENTNPIRLDSRGECTIWLDSTKTYKFELRNALGVLQWSADNITGAAALADRLRTDLAASGGSCLVGYMPAGTDAVATTVQAKLRESVSAVDFGADPTGVADATTAIVNALATGKDVCLTDGTYRLAPTVAQTIANNGYQRLYGEGNVTLSVNLASSIDLLVFNGPVSLEKLTVDFNNSFARYPFKWVANVGHIEIRNIRVMNLKDTNSSTGSAIFLLQGNGNTFNIDGVSASSLLKMGNGVIGDSNGSLELIYVTTTSGGTQGKISNIFIDEMHNINASDVVIYEDTAGIYIGTASDDDKNNITISDVYGVNFGKRLLKIQASNVTVSRIRGASTTGDSSGVVNFQHDTKKGCSATDVTATGIMEYAVSAGANGVRLKNITVSTTPPSLPLMDTVAIGLFITGDNTSVDGFDGTCQRMVSLGGTTAILKNTTLKNLRLNITSATTQGINPRGSLLGIDNLLIDGVYVMHDATSTGIYAIDFGLKINGTTVKARNLTVNNLTVQTASSSFGSGAIYFKNCENVQIDVVNYINTSGATHCRIVWLDACVDTRTNNVKIEGANSIGVYVQNCTGWNSINAVQNPLSTVGAVYNGTSTNVVVSDTDHAKIAEVVDVTKPTWRWVKYTSSTTAFRPTTGLVAGYTMYFDITLGKPIWWNGTVWKDAAGTTV